MSLYLNLIFSNFWRNLSKKIFILIIITAAFTSCKSAGTKAVSRKTVNYKITNKGYSSAQMSLNQVNSVIFNLAQLAMNGMVFEYHDDEIKLRADNMVTSDDFHNITNDRKIEIVRNVYKIYESGSFSYRSQDINGVRSNVVLNADNSGNILSSMIVTSIRRNFNPGTEGKIFITGNVVIDDEKGRGSAIFIIETD